MQIQQEEAALNERLARAEHDLVEVVSLEGRLNERKKQVIIWSTRWSSEQE